MIAARTATARRAREHEHAEPGSEHQTQSGKEKRLE